TSGTRMQEGLLALMQLPRIAVALNEHSKAGLAHIALVTDPTTGSAYGGFVNLADYIIAEPNALVGYSALRVLQEAEGQDLPAGSHTSESHLRNGLIDSVVTRPQLREHIGVLLGLLNNEDQRPANKENHSERQVHSPHGAWQQVQLSRHSKRPTASDLIDHMATSFIELHGDRSGIEDGAVRAGFASISGEAVVLIGQVRPNQTEVRSGWIRPAGFRKARRALLLATKFNIPVVALVDTAGARPDLEAEERGLGDAMARCLSTMLNVPAPTIAVITGEANSEAAVSMAAADRVLMLDNAVYEVIRPEDAASFLYQESHRAGEVAERLRITSHDCLRMGIVDGTIHEPGEGAHTSHEETAALIRRAVVRELGRLRRERPKHRLKARYDRYREIGSTRSKVRGTLERRLAHLVDRIETFTDSIRRRKSGRGDYRDYPDIPV
ncbi:hypothetical protein AYO38_00940, partial [bacterium SCGC AG-212-C10]